MAIGRFMRKKNLGKRRKREKKLENGILFTKIVLTYCEKNCFRIEKNFLRSLEQFIQTMKSQNNFW